MNEIPNNELAPRGSSPPVDLSSSTVRVQLLWASLFPLVFFGLLILLAISSTLYTQTLALVTERNLAQVQKIAGSSFYDSNASSIENSLALNSDLISINPVKGSALFLIDERGALIASSDLNLSSLPLDNNSFDLITQKNESVSQLMESTLNNDEVVVSFAPVPGKQMGLVLIEPWSGVMTPAYNYQLVLAGLLVLCVALSLGMLSLSIARVMRPVAILVENAIEAVPGSTFHPIPEQGPRELRSLINAFNQMVIRLAEQQTTLRQYANMALLSQEEERLRLSHELHDGTLQDLVGLTQRIELYRNELENKPESAPKRLDELTGLLEKTLDDVRRISIALRPPVLEDFGLIVAVENLCDDLKKDKFSLNIDYSINGEIRRLNSDLELAVYRVIQEALTNIRKHAPDATTVQVNLFFGESEFQVSIKNDGASFSNQNINSFVKSGHIGLVGMYERARLYGGTLSINIDSDKKTIVLLNVPYSKDLIIG
jgi:signal transduction histidine kinase